MKYFIQRLVLQIEEVKIRKEIKRLLKNFEP